jgi:hypothetical protein
MNHRILAGLVALVAAMAIAITGVAVASDNTQIAPVAERDDNDDGPNDRDNDRDDGPNDDD